MWRNQLPPNCLQRHRTHNVIICIIFVSPLWVLNGAFYCDPFVSGSSALYYLSESYSSSLRSFIVNCSLDFLFYVFIVCDDFPCCGVSEAVHRVSRLVCQHFFFFWVQFFYLCSLTYSPVRISNETRLEKNWNVHTIWWEIKDTSFVSDCIVCTVYAWQISLRG